MNCRSFEQAWNDYLDAGPDAPADPGPALSAHAATCPSCRSLGEGYRALAVALGGSSLLPALGRDFAARVVAAAEADRSRALRLHALRWLAPLATAAAVVGMVAVGLGKPEEPSKPDVAAASGPIDPRDLTDALADVGIASLALAREASAPAARVGTEVIGASGLTGDSSRLAWPLPGVPVGRPPSWEGVGESVTARARPLSVPARNAFGFLAGLAPRG